MRLLRLLTEPERRSRKGGQGETCNELPARGARWRREVAPLLAGFVLSPCGGPRLTDPRQFISSLTVEL